MMKSPRGYRRSRSAARALRAIAAEPRQARAEGERRLFSSRRASGAAAALQVAGAAAPMPMCASFGVWPPSQPHIAAIRLPKAAHRGFGDAVVIGGDARAAHLHDREKIR